MNDTPKDPVEAFMDALDHLLYEDAQKHNTRIRTMTISLDPTETLIIDGGWKNVEPNRAV